MRSDKAGAFRASNTDLVELDDPSLTLEGPLLTLDDPFADQVSHVVHTVLVYTMLVPVQCTCAIHIT